MSQRLFFIICLYCISCTTVYAYKLQCASQKKGTIPYDIRPTPSYDHDRFGTEPSDLHFEYGAFISSFDSDDDDYNDEATRLLGIPHWVAYQIKAYRNHSADITSPNPSIKRAKWYEHPELAFLVQQPNVTKKKIDESYSGVGNTWNRGHLAMSSHANRIGWKQACNTHYFINAVPQRALFNQGIWLNLEAYSGAVANKYGNVWVITGPIFYDEPIKTIGDSNEVPIAIPHALFKILIREPEDKSRPETLAFIYDQNPNNFKKCRLGKTDLYDHMQHITSVKEIEKLTGLTFFNNLALTKTFKKAHLEAYKAEIATALWPVEDRYYGVKCGAPIDE